MLTEQRKTLLHGAAYVEAGEGEPVVLVHGVGLRVEAWAPQIESLAATHRVVSEHRHLTKGNRPAAQCSAIFLYLANLRHGGRRRTAKNAWHSLSPVW